MLTVIIASLHSPDIKCANSEKHSHARLHKVKKRLCHVSSQRLPSNLLWSTLMTKPYSSNVKVKFIRHDTHCDKKNQACSYLIKILSYKSSRRSKKQHFFFCLLEKVLNKTTPAAELNLKHPASVAFSLPAVPPCPRQDSSRYTGDEELYNQIEFFVFFFFSFCRTHGSIQWQSVCPCKSHWSAAKSSLDHRGLCLGPKASPWQVVPSWALARWLSATKGQWRYFLKKYSSRHPKPAYWTTSPSLPLSLSLSVYTNTDTMPYCRVFLWPHHYVPT